MNSAARKKKYQFKFMPGDKVYTTFDREKVIGIVDACAISYNPVPKYWVIFEVSKVSHIGLYGKTQGWYPEVLLKKEKS